MSSRPAVSMIIPFAGSRAELDRLVGDLAELRLGNGDEVIVADNRRTCARPHDRGQLRVVPAAGLRSPGFARNRAARIGQHEWLVFIDADATPTPSLLDDYFDPPPRPSTAVLAGGILDVAERASFAARHSAARRQMGQQTTLRRSGTPYAQSANCAVRRRAFEEVGGFAEEVRAGEDADLCFRLEQAGWLLEERLGATVSHRSRATLRGLLRQLVNHGSGAAWLNGRYPGSFPPSGPRELTGRLARGSGAALAGMLRGDREAAGFALLDVAGAVAFELGRLRSNQARRG